MTSTPPQERKREPLRNVRVPDPLWIAAREAVAKRGDPSVSHIIRIALAQYVRATDRMEKQGTLPRQRSER